MSPATGTTVRTGIEPFDERTGGLEEGGTYLVVGAPGPAKMVAVYGGRDGPAVADLAS